METEDITIKNPDVVTKYKTAAEIAQKALKAVVDGCVVGAKVLDLVLLGDKAINDAVAGVYRKSNKEGARIAKGVAFPTCISVNNCVCHFCPLPSEPEVALKEEDVVKIELGVHIDGFAAQIGHTVVVGASKGKVVTGRKADALTAAYMAGEAALRTIKPGNKCSDVSSIVERVVAQYNCKCIEGFSSHQVEKDTLDGEKFIVFNASEAQKKDLKDTEFEELEAYAIDILVSTGEGKARQLETKTTVYKKTASTYLLKLKASRAVYTEVSSKFGSMAFPLRLLEDEKKGRMGLVECGQHGLVTPYDVLYEKEGEIVALYKFTVLLMPNGPLRITTPPVDTATFKSDVSLAEDLQSIVVSPIKKKVNKKKKAAAAAGKEDDAKEEEDEAEPQAESK